MENTTQTRDIYYHQKQYAKRNRNRLNDYRMVYRHRKKYFKFLDNKEKVETFKKHKKYCLMLQNLDRDLCLQMVQRLSKTMSNPSNKICSIFLPETLKRANDN